MKYRNDNYYYNIIRKNITKYRKEKNITQKELAKRIGYSVSYLNAIESKVKKKTFSIIILGRIADVLDINIKEFFNK